MARPGERVAGPLLAVGVGLVEDELAITLEGVIRVQRAGVGEIRRQSLARLDDAVEAAEMPGQRLGGGLADMADAQRVEEQPEYQA